MNEPFIIDAHAHIGAPGVFFAPEYQFEQLIDIMDRMNVRHAVAVDHFSLFEGTDVGLPVLRGYFQKSGGRIYYLGVFNPRRSEQSLAAIEEAANWPGFVGLKIHPSFHRVPAEDVSYEPAWRFAADNDFPILTHSWSVSEYNPVQHLSTPGRFEGYVREFRDVRFVLGHTGGRGAGRHEAIRMANEYSGVYLDFAGDIFCHRLIETLVESVPVNKILFGSDFPWLDPRANLSRVLLAEVDDVMKKNILRDNAMSVYTKIGQT